MPSNLNKINYLKAKDLTRAFILSNSGAFPDVDDILQEGFRILWENLQKEDFILFTSAENYIYQVCRKLWLKELRRRNIEKKPNHEIIFDSLCDQEDLEMEMQREKLMCILERNIEKLAPRGRELYSLKFKGLSLQEIASQMGLKNHRIAKDKYYREKKRLISLIKQDPEYQQFFYSEKEIKIIDDDYL